MRAILKESAFNLLVAARIPGHHFPHGPSPDLSDETSQKPTSSPANFRFGRQNGRDREHSPWSTRRPSRIDIKPCDTLTHTSVEPLGTARFCVAVRTCMAGVHQFCDASPPEDSIES